MKVQDIKKDCSAIVGLSLEFSNSEIASLSHLLWKVDAAIDKATDQQITMMKSFEQGTKLLDFKDNVPVAIDLKTLTKVQWLLTIMTRQDTSNLFDPAEVAYESILHDINNAVSSTPIK